MLTFETYIKRWRGNPTEEIYKNEACKKVGRFYLKEVKIEVFSIEVAMLNIIEKMSIGYSNEKASRNLGKSNVSGV